MRAAAEAEFQEYAVSAMPSLLRTAYLITGDRHDAEDLVQAALARTYVAWPKIRDARAIDAYIRRAMLNAHISGWRRARRIRFSALESSAETAAPETEAHLGAVELRGVLFPALKRLTARQRAVLVLRFYEDRSEA